MPEDGLPDETDKTLSLTAVRMPVWDMMYQNGIRCTKKQIVQISKSQSVTQFTIIL